MTSLINRLGEERLAPGQSFVAWGFGAVLGSAVAVAFLFVLLTGSI